MEILDAHHVVGRGAITIWRLIVQALEGADVPLYYFRAEGGPLSEEDREAVFDYYRDHILTSPEPYLQLIDLRDGIDNAAAHLLPLAAFSKSVRSLQRQKLLRSVMLSDSALLCGVVRCVLRIAPPAVPFLICGGEEEAWRHVLGDLEGAREVWNDDAAPKEAEEEEEGASTTTTSIACA